MTESGSIGCHVALFRGLNVGQVGSPTRDELLAAFKDADSARTFQSNGTILFRSDEPHEVARAARRALQRDGHRHELLVRRLEALASVVEETPATHPADNVYKTMVSFYDLQVLPAVPLPLRSRNGLVEVHRLDEGIAVSACWKRGSSAGDVTGFLEALLGVPATTRTLGTCERLVAAAGDLGSLAGSSTNEVDDRVGSEEIQRPATPQQQHHTTTVTTRICAPV